ncbi:MAG: bifunctional sulfate adenylyltransferase/adenylylsulfate kinase [Candidatus Nitricoxidivorans perseverans]|uniref:Adenylyl-sulfate kinase n=1 Tax=Candidatus Nitricoxidivorans perseverans TaxID=2975601 RepID=A0AA49FLD5_9PROT|nr:MAG: bifunctional sulfate adenylyltransferase/adenylylsulfate kinase [Candidatus Nitricoxidivorans perseverans]
MESLIPPYGDRLVELLATPDRAAAIREEALGMPSLDLTWTQICQLELLLNGAFSPLQGFMGRADLESVLKTLKLADGRWWPQPVVLAVDEKAAQALRPGQAAALRDGEGFMPAILHISETWPADPEAEIALAEAAGVPLSQPLAQPGQHYVAGRLEGVALPPRHDFPAARLTPRELREQFTRRGWRRVLGCQPGQPMHRPQLEFIQRAAIRHEANLFIQPTAGSDPVLESSHVALVRACQALLPRLPAATTFFALSPMIPLPAGPRETLLRAVTARNYGASHLVVGGETIDDGMRRRGQDHTGLAGEASVGDCVASIGVALVSFPRMVYLEDSDEYLPQEEAPAYSRKQVMGGRELNRRLTLGLKIPDWFSYPEVIEELRRFHPPRSRQGLTVFFTGLSGAGKSTLAKALAVKLTEMGGRRVTLLDGDIVRKNLSSELGFSREHRDINIRRIGFVASEITKHGGIAICAPIAPYRNTRRDVRRMIECWGGFIEIHVSTPIEVCEGRDRKGLYAKARAGLIPEFTGVSDPYEIPAQPELAIDTSRYSVDEAVQSVILKLEHEGFLR